MKLTFFTLLSLTCIHLASCKKEPTAYEKLKAATGATDQELEDAIGTYIKIQALLEDGTIKPEDATALIQQTKETLATVQRDDEAAAIWTLGYLKALETQDEQRAIKLMSDHLIRFTEREFPNTEASARIRKNIIEYAQTSPSLEQLKKKEAKPSK